MNELLLGISLVLANLQKQVNELQIKQVQAQEITFADLPQFLQEISFCESGARQYYANGKLVIGPYGEIGFFQIMPKVWGKKAKELKLDLKDPNDNMTFALWLHSEYGTKPWLASKKCWSK